MSEGSRSTSTPPANEEYAIDVDKLIALVESRPVIYNAVLKDHHNIDVLTKCWQEIGKEMNLPGNACKIKWTNLRSSYTRFMRECKRTPSGSGQKKKKWYLADAMSFLQKYSGPFRAMTSNFSSTHTSSPTASAQNSPGNIGNEECSPSLLNPQDVYIVDDNDMTQCELNTTLPPVITEQNNNVVPKKIRKKTAAELVAAPMAEFLKSASEKRKQNEEQKKEEDPMLTFFRSLLPDTNLLDMRRKRQFKNKVQALINDMLDEQEMENIANPIPPTPAKNNNDGSYTITQLHSGNIQSNYTYEHPVDQFHNQYSDNHL